MFDAREQFGDVLETVCDNVKMSKPDGDVELPLICYAQTENVPENIAYDRLKWRVAIYTSTFEELVELTDAVDKAIVKNLGYTRVYRSSDGDAHIGTDLYLCRLDYSGLVNKMIGAVVRHTT